MAKGISYLHEKDTIHGDLKSANVFLVKDGSIKLGNFNFSNEISNEESPLSAQLESHCYTSPETDKSKIYDSKSDIWSLGWVLYEMAALLPPFRSKHIKS